MVYSSNATKALYVIIENVRKAQDITEQQKDIMEMALKRGFDLGYASAHEECAGEKKKWMNEVLEMGDEELKNYKILYKGLLDYETGDITREPHEKTHN